LEIIVDDISTIELSTPLPAEGTVDTTYRIEGTVKILDTIGAPPWIYAEVQKKDWYKPDVIEETDYKRGFPVPISGEFKIDWTPEKTGIYEVTVIATPAPLSLPAIGVFPVVGKSELMKITIAAVPEAGLDILSCSFT
jgi:hypothetical protein